jgi:hypothetical protein
VCDNVGVECGGTPSTNDSTHIYTALEATKVSSSTSHFNKNSKHTFRQLKKCNSQPSYPSLPSWLLPRPHLSLSLSKSPSPLYSRLAESFRRGQLGTLLDPTLEGLQPTVAGLGLGVLNPTVAGLKSTVDVAKRGALGTLLDPTLEGLQPTVAGLGLGVLVPTVDGLQGTVDVAKRGALGTVSPS